MRTDLSSQIKLSHIPERYYKPATAYDKSVISRFEKINTEIKESVQEAGIHVAREIASRILVKKALNQPCVLALCAGNSPRIVYKELVRMYKEENLRFDNVVVFNISEYYPVEVNSPFSNLGSLKAMLLDQVDIKSENIHSIDANIEKNLIYESCHNYEQLIDSFNGIDLALIGVGLVGNIAYNAPGAQPNSETRVVLLDSESRNSIAKYYSKKENVPTTAITMGLGTLQKAKKIIMIADGANKAKVLYEAIEQDYTSAIPASFLQSHKNAMAVLDLDAASLLTRIVHPWKVGSCEWDDKTIRRAIVWLAQKLNKPILKLTDKDYGEKCLGELLAIYGSAYNVNIKVFNDLQRTITGWPGGKPNADDTYRPERAKPFPKKVVVFSPHPDDDVISMGGTFRRLVVQNHDVHVAYQTSGNIAVGDEDAIRYAAMMVEACRKFTPAHTDFMERAEKALNFMLHEKKDGDLDTADVRFLKGYIRREEAKSACRYIGVKPENVNFLDLPFYETGAVKKGELECADIDIVKALITKVKPDQIFVAGDLADPHGTHKVCLNAILAAIDDVKDEQWMKECHIWMYRGAWAEWEIENIEMAVPMSPEELRSKRNSILKHQSQMENAPFLGNDDRLFWQRSEARNKATAEFYEQLGLASYEAIEAFVRYTPIP